MRLFNTKPIHCQTMEKTVNNTFVDASNNKIKKGIATEINTNAHQFLLSKSSRFVYN